MKSYKEMAQSVFERRDKYIEKRKITAGKFKIIIFSFVCCVILAAVLVFAVRSEMNKQQHTDTLQGPTDNPGRTELSEVGSKAANELNADKAVLSENIRNDISAHEWMTFSQVSEAFENPISGVCVPSFLACGGGFYGVAEADANALYSAGDGEVWFNKSYGFPIYLIKDKPQNFAIYINGGMTAYSKIFDVTFEIDGILYGIHRKAGTDEITDMGEAVISNDNYTVYSLHSEENDAYIVNILPLLRQHYPLLFSDDENYGDAWQLALPLN